jgi:hypothetical protein
VSFSFFLSIFLILYLQQFVLNRKGTLKNKIKEKKLDMDFHKQNKHHTKSASFAAAASSELTCLKSMHGLPHPFSTTISGTEDKFSLEPSKVSIIASTSKPPASAALRRMSQCCGQEESVPFF